MTKTILESKRTCPLCKAPIQTNWKVCDTKVCRYKRGVAMRKKRKLLNFKFKIIK